MNNQRTCWAIKQLIKEAHELFPETAVKVGGYNERNVGLEVEFITLDQPGLNGLLWLVEGDPRVQGVTAEDGQSVLITFRNSARTQDLRDSFGLAEAWEILEDDDES